MIVVPVHRSFTWPKYAKMKDSATCASKAGNHLGYSRKSLPLLRSSRLKTKKCLFCIITMEIPSNNITISEKHYFFLCQHLTCPLTLGKAMQKCHRQGRLSCGKRHVKSVYVITLTITCTDALFQHRLNTSASFRYEHTCSSQTLLKIYWANSAALLVTSEITAFVIRKEKLCQRVFVLLPLNIQKSNFGTTSDFLVCRLEVKLQSCWVNSKHHS